MFVADGGAARFQPVTPGLIGGLDIEVSGVNEGTTVVVGPFQALRELQDGQAVRTQGLVMTKPPGGHQVGTACPLDCPDSCSLSVSLADGRVVDLDGGTPTR